jgi:ATP/maltotriose-dependent transcriptional regulator MalT
MHFFPLTLNIFIGVSDLLGKMGQLEQAVALLDLVLHHLASDHETHDQAQQSLADYQAQLAPDIFEAALQRGQQSDLNTVILAIQTEFASLEGITDSPDSQASPQKISSPLPPLIEPLTTRELEVLHLIAEGHTNQQIAETLVISLGTAKWYTSQIYSKLGVSNRTQAVARARDLNLFS